MHRFALILFDEDGCTAIVDTKKLRGSKTELQTSMQCVLGMSVGQQYKVEILHLSDSKVQLNQFEKTWSKSQRSEALDRAKTKRGNVVGGYLSIWPQDSSDTETVSDENIGCDVQVQSSSHENRDEDSLRGSRKRRKTESSRPSRTKQQEPTATTENVTNDSTGVNGETSVSSTIEGTNNRKVTVLFEGGGDYSVKGVSPLRLPFCTEHLTNDQKDLLHLQVREYERNKRTFATQTKKVVVMATEKDVENLIVKEGVDKETQCDNSCFVQEIPRNVSENVESSQCENISLVSCKCSCQENSEKLDRLFDLVNSMKDKLDEKLDSSLISVDLLETLILPNKDQVETNKESASASSQIHVGNLGISGENDVSVQNENESEVQVNDSGMEGSAGAIDLQHEIRTTGPEDNEDNVYKFHAVPLPS